MAQNITDLTMLHKGKVWFYNLHAFYSVKEHPKMGMFHESIRNVKKMQLHFICSIFSAQENFIIKSDNLPIN